MAGIESIPTMSPEHGIGEREAKLIHGFNEVVHGQPGTYLHAVQHLAQTAGLSDVVPDVASVDAAEPDAAATGMMQRYLEDRLEISAELDSDTVAALDNDTVFRSLLETMHQSRRTIVHPPGAKNATVSRPSETAPIARERLSVYRLLFFICRVHGYYAAGHQNQTVSAHVPPQQHAATSGGVPELTFRAP